MFRQTARRFTKFSLLTLALVGVGLIFNLTHPLPKALAVAPAACASAPDASRGYVTQYLQVPVTGDYSIWSRISHDTDGANKNSFYLQIDDGCAINVGDKAFADATWTWVNYSDGAVANVIRPHLSAGSHKFVYTGKEDNLKLDRVILLSDAACTPTGKGTNCAAADTTAPVVSVAGPADGSTVKGSISLTTSTDDANGVSDVTYYMDGTGPSYTNGTPIGSIQHTSPYTVSWDTTTASDTLASHTHTIAAVATDPNGNTGVSHVTVTVDNHAPTVPTGLTATANSSTQVTLNWTGSTDNVAVRDYTVYRDGVARPTKPTTTTFVDTGLTAGQTYSYTVQANDAVNSSAQTAAKSVTTTAAGQSDLIVTGVTWSPATPAVGNAVTFSATIKNQGSVATPASTIHDVMFSVDGANVSLSNSDTASLAAGASITLTANTGSTGSGAATWTATNGGHTIAATVDSGSRITESNEGNNTLSATLTIGSGGVVGDVDGNGSIELTDVRLAYLQFIDAIPDTPAADINHDGSTGLGDYRAIYVIYLGTL